MKRIDSSALSMNALYSTYLQYIPAPPLLIELLVM